MKIGLFTDVHSNSSPEKSRLIITTLKRMKEQFESDGIKRVIFLGDFF